MTDLLGQGEGTDSGMHAPESGKPLNKRNQEHKRSKERQVEANPPTLACEQLRLPQSGEQHALNHNGNPEQMAHLRLRKSCNFRPVLQSLL